MSPRTSKPQSLSVSARKKKSSEVETISFVSLGCPKNLVDSEKMLGLLAEDGLMPVNDPDDADAVVINTCGFLEASRIESVDEINKAAELKKQGKIKRIIVAGCLVQRHRAKMLEWCPDIDAMIGVFDRDRIVDAVRGTGLADPKNREDGKADGAVYSSISGSSAIAKKARRITEEGYFEDDASRLRLTPRHYAYLRISEGCNQNCAFCTIPSIRGKMRSKPLDKVLVEARELLNDGAFELNLIGQDTTSYGNDIGYTGKGKGLVGLLTAMNKIAGEFGGAWVRLMYAYPSCFEDDMIDANASLPNIVKYIDMPLQHINDKVLDSMRRKTSRKLIETLLDKLRKKIVDRSGLGMAIRTTFITGYPGETDAQHRELVEFVRDFGFDAMGVFPYSPEPGTPAGALYDSGKAIPEDVVQARLEELMLVQQEVAFGRNKQLSEKSVEMDILIDAQTKSSGKQTSGVGKGGKLYVGRGYHQAPQIDGVTFVQSREKLSPGELVRCRVIDSDGYDLIARPITEIGNTLSLPVRTR
jgi:ribosomal protein S12 methylthiotransferase